MTNIKIEIDSATYVTEKIIVTKNKQYSVWDICSLEFEEEKQSINMVTTFRQRYLIIKFNNGESTYFSCQSPILKKNKYANIQKAYSFLSNLTYQHRYEFYTEPLRKNGYFDYSVARIYSDGTISTIANPNKRISLRNAYAEDRLSLGRSYGVFFIGYSETDPKAIKVFERSQKGFFSMSDYIQFWGSENRDVIIAILRNLYSTFP